MRKPRAVLLACLPKSGSTLVARLLTNVLEGRKGRLFRHSSGREMELDRLCVWSETALLGRIGLALKYGDRRVLTRVPLISQQHIRFSSETLRLCGRHRVGVVVLRRSLEECATSLADYLADRPHYRWMGVLPDDFWRYSPEQRQLWVVRHVMPWYVSFSLSWQRYSGLSRDQIIDYSEVISSEGACLAVPVSCMMSRDRGVLQKKFVSEFRRVDSEQRHLTRHSGHLGRDRKLLDLPRQYLHELIAPYPELS